jgi:AAA domain/R3H domain
MNGIGFLRDDRRLNVAVTRAKRHCCVICDTETVSQSSFVKNLVEWIEEHGEQQSALEFMSEVQSGQIDADLVLAALELERLMEIASRPNKAAEKRPKQRQALDPVDTEHRRQALLEKISSFQSNATPGDEMVMSTELSKLDRKLVHEIAEDLGLGHQSEGVDGVNRRIKLIIPNQIAILNATDSSTASVRVEGQESSQLASVENVAVTVAEEVDEYDIAAEEAPMMQPTTTSIFAALEVDDEDNDVPMDGNEGVAERPVLNNVLGDLAKERAERERQKHREQTAKKLKKKKGQKLGGAKKSDTALKAEGLEELNDLAFLDAQIDKVQNSHGRNVEGTGKNYRTIVSGVLLAKPKPKEKEKDVRASAALSAKLREAQEGRKAKPKKK